MNTGNINVREPGLERPLEAILLMGPTGSGKTPLGEFLAAGGPRARRCFHFDFGHQLRLAAADVHACAYFSQAEMSVLKTVLRSGTLLEDEHFGIAAGIIRRFVDCNSIGSSDLVILNGLPRHVGQAEAISPFFSVRLVVHLQCDARTVLARIGLNAGGDRDNRTDDGLADVSRRLQLFSERSMPLLDHYRAIGIPIAEAPVGVDTQARELAGALSDPLATCISGGRDVRDGA
jgi:adenylate kinase family enzyme